MVSLSSSFGSVSKRKNSLDTLFVSHYEYIHKLEIADDSLLNLMEDFTREMEYGINKNQPSSLKMIDSFVHTLPSGNEQGSYFAFDLGGTNLRVLKIDFNGNSQSVSEKRNAIPAEVMTADSPTPLFDFIAKHAAGFFVDDIEVTDNSQIFPAGFTFSFPINQTGINKGKLIEWTKGFTTKGVIGENPAELLQLSLDRMNIPIKIVALCNDTVGTLMTCAFEESRKRRSTAHVCRIGVILGTGTNAAYVNENKDGSLAIINMEWGGYSLNIPGMTKFDEQVDLSSPNPGRQLFEKAISGMYLGEITRRIAVEICQINGIDYSQIQEANSLSTGDVSDFVKSYFGNINSLTTFELIIGQIGKKVMKRSSLLCAAAIAATCRKTVENSTRLGPRGNEVLTIGVDGSLFCKGHLYSETLLEDLRHCLSLYDLSYLVDRVSIVHSNDGSGVGAALIATVG